MEGLFPMAGRVHPQLGLQKGQVPMQCLMGTVPTTWPRKPTNFDLQHRWL